MNEENRFPFFRMEERHIIEYNMQLRSRNLSVETMEKTIVREPVSSPPIDLVTEFTTKVNTLMSECSEFHDIKQRIKGIIKIYDYLIENLYSVINEPRLGVFIPVLRETSMRHFSDYSSLAMMYGSDPEYRLQLVMLADRLIWVLGIIGQENS